MIGQQQGKERLLKLAAHLTTVPRKGFDMGYFSQCGAPACALGHATTIFDELHLDKGGGLVYTNVHEGVVLRMFGMDAAQYFFCLSIYDANKLFSGENHRADGKHLPETPKMVAKRLRAHVRTDSYVMTDAADDAYARDKG